MEQKQDSNVDLKYRLRMVRELALKLFMADELVRQAMVSLLQARDQADLYFPEPHASTPMAFSSTTKLLLAYRDCLRTVRTGLHQLREHCYDTATDFRSRLAPVVISCGAREFPPVGDLNSGCRSEEEGVTSP